MNLRIAAAAVGGIVLLLVGSALMRSCRSEPYHPPRCGTTLKMLALSLKMYAETENSGRLPSLSPEAGRLFFSVDELHPEYIFDLNTLRCPWVLNPPGRFERWFYYDDHTSIDSVGDPRIDDFDYMYVGYKIVSVQDGLRFIRTYAHAALEQFENPTTPLHITNALNSEFEPLEIVADEDASRIPLIIERPGHHPDGSVIGDYYILFLDGHVQSNYLNSNRVDPIDAEVFEGLVMLAELDELPPGERQQRLEMLVNYGR